MPSTGWEEQWLQGGDAATNNANVGLDSRPDPNFVARPGDVVGLVEGVMNPVRTEATGNHNNATNRE